MPSDGEQVQKLRAALEELVNAFEELLTYEGSQHSLHGTQVAGAIRPHVDRARDLAKEIRETP